MPVGAGGNFAPLRRRLSRMYVPVVFVGTLITMPKVRSLYVAPFSALAAKSGMLKCNVVKMPVRMPVSSICPRYALYTLRDGAVMYICTAPNQNGFACTVGIRKSSDTFEPT